MGRAVVIRPYLVGGALAALVASHAFVGWHAYDAGVSAEAARQAAATRELNDRLRRAEDARRAATQAFLRERREAADLERRLSDEAREDPDADRRAFGLGSVRRIDSVR